MKDYAVTVKKTRKPIEIKNYIDYLKFISPQFNVQNVNIEDTRGYHLHFIIKSDSVIDFKGLYPAKYGWNIKCIPIYNRNGWIKYCEKDFMKNLHNRRLLLQEESDEEIHPTEQDYIDSELYDQYVLNLKLKEINEWIPQKRILFKTD